VYPGKQSAYFTSMPMIRKPDFWNVLYPTIETEKSDVISHWAILGILVLIFGVAAWARFSISPVPFFNPDAMGYVGPVLSNAISGEMNQTHYRGFFYPLFLRFLMNSGESLGLVTLVQHLGGLASGLLWWLIWSSWSARLHNGWLRRAIAPMIGLFLLLVYLWSANTIFLEHSIRPESLFPLFALAQVLFTCWSLTLATLGQRFLTAAVGCTFLAIWSGCTAVALRPSWSLAWVGFAFMLLFLIRCVGWKSRSLWSIFAAVLTAILSWKVFVFAAEHAFSWKKESNPSDILAKALVAVHAPQIIDFWTAPARWENLSVENQEFLMRLQQGVEDSRERQHGYHRLGFDPDYIWFRTDILLALPVPWEEHVDYLMSWYRPLLLHAPWLLLPKLQQQFLLATIPTPKILYSNSIQPRKHYVRSLQDLEHYRESRPPEFMAPLNVYYATLGELVEESPERDQISPTVNALFLQLIQFSLIPALLFSLLAGLWFLLPGKAGVSVRAEPAIWSAFFLGGLATVAVVHSFDINRYQHALVPFQLLVAGGGLGLILPAVQRFLHARVALLAQKIS